MIEPILFGTHLLAAILGAVIMRSVILRADRALHEPHPTKETPVPDSKLTPEHRFRLRLSLVLLITSVFFISVGASALLFQRQQDASDKQFAATQECLNDFAQEFSEAANARSDVATELDAAQDARDKAELNRDNALDDIIDIVTKARLDPPRATEEDFDKALATFAKAKAKLVDAQKIYDDARDKFDKVKKASPYPKADCS